MATTITSPAPQSAWRELLSTDTGATAQQTPEYLAAVVAATGGRDVSRLYELGDGRRLILPVVRQRSLPGVHLDAAYPGGFGHGGLLAGGGLRADDVRVVIDDLQRRRVLSTRIGGHHHTAEQWATARLPGVVLTPRRVDVIDLEQGFGHLWDHGFRRATRQSVRKAERAGVEVERDTTGRLVPVFHQIYLAWVERWLPKSGLPPQVARRLALFQEPRRKFEAVAARLGEKCRIWVAWHDGRAVASSITLVHGKHAIGWRSYSIRELAGPIAANTLIQRLAIEDACLSGCRYFDLGQSGGVADLHSFKHSLGGSPRSVVDVRVEAESLSRVRAGKDRVQASVVEALGRRSSSRPQVSEAPSAVQAAART